MREKLEQEVSFWRELIIAFDGEGSETELNRMREALLLAEYKLAQLSETLH